ncbi:MAG: ArsR/SmtB family transcription factor [Moorellales bacterium]
MNEMGEEHKLAELARLFKLLGDGNRLRILFTLGGRERSVSEVIEATALPQSLVSFHLGVLREAGLVAADRRGAFVYYRLTYPELLERMRGLEPYAPAKLGKPPYLARPPFPCPPWSRRRS